MNLQGFRTDDGDTDDQNDDQNDDYNDDHSDRQAAHERVMVLGGR